jgi:hypothetical protein
MRAEIFRICMNNDASYCDSANDSFKWIPSQRDMFDLVVKVKTLDLLKAKKIVESTEELCAVRGFEVSLESQGNLDIRLGGIFNHSKLHIFREVAFLCRVD